MKESDWIKWKTSYDEDPYKDTSWLEEFRIRIFEKLLILGALLMLLIVIIALFRNRLPVADFGNAVLFIVLYILVKHRPENLRIFMWLGLLVLLVNLIDGFSPSASELISPSYILYPLLILYGVLLGDLWIALTALMCVVCILVYSIVRHYPLSGYDFFMLTNLFILIFASGVAALIVWKQHQQFITIVKRQADDLRNELDTKLRMNALVFHDINNPLCFIGGTLDLIKRKGDFRIDDIELLGEMTKRISSIIESARGLESGRDLLMVDIPVSQLFLEQNELFSQRFTDKEQSFVFEGAKNLSVCSNNEVLRNSVFSNFLSNAVKFSPKGSTIKMNAEKEGDDVRVSIIDSGDGFSEELLRKGYAGEAYASKRGTEGEMGSAYGLMIASICLRNLGGSLQVKNINDEGACVSAVLPAS